MLAMSTRFEVAAIDSRTGPFMNCPAPIVELSVPAMSGSEVRDSSLRIEQITGLAAGAVNASMIFAQLFGSLQGSLRNLSSPCSSMFNLSLLLNRRIVNSG
jgi:hypothetical protein